MTRSRLLLAICLAMLLVGGATWKRIESAQVSKSSGLIVISDAANNNNPVENVNTSGADLNATTSATAPTENLTNTDLMSRQLFSDYISLAANGQATPDNLDALGDQYASSIVSSSQAKSITIYNLNTESDSRTNLQVYSDSLSRIYGKYSAQLITVTKTNTDPNNFSPTTIAFAKKVANLYQKEADELQALSVPNSLASDYLKLINFYLARAWDMNAIANSDTDPADAYTAIASETNLDGKEQIILTNIKRLLVSSGIILRNS